MSRLKKADVEKIKTLEYAVINNTPDEVAEIYKELGDVAFTAHVLGIACRFRGAGMVKVLIENGATFAYDVEVIKHKYIDLFGSYYPGKASDFTHLLFRDSLLAYDIILSGYVQNLVYQNKNLLRFISDEEFIKTLMYLCENAEKTAFDPGDFLYYMILTNETKIVCALKDAGVTLSGEKIKLLTEGGSDWYMFCFLTKKLGETYHDNVFKQAMLELISQTGNKKLHFTGYFCDMNSEKFFNPKFFGFFLENFNQSKMNKTKILKEIIRQGNIGCLETAIQNEWLKLPGKRDEMIEFAQENATAETLAYLLDFKNRTADFAAESRKAEKKMMAELNAAPDSVASLKKLWTFKKREDGTLVITRYKGRQTDISVPSKIGKNKVTAIGKLAFSPHAGRLTDEEAAFRKTITSITLPEGITEIAGSAFWSCAALQSVNIPDGVSKIGESAFCGCIMLKNINFPDTLRTIGNYALFKCNSLQSLIIPEGVIEIGLAAFANCILLETVELPASVNEIKSDKRLYYKGCLDCSYKACAIVPKGSYAEEYCRDNRIAFTYKE